MPEKSSRLQDGSEIIGYILIQPKLPFHPVGRIMNKMDALIGQIRQPPNISGCQVFDPPFIKSYQQGGGPNNGHKGTNGRVRISKPIAQIFVGRPRKTKSLVKELNGWVPK